MLLLAIMGTDVVQLESRLVEEDLLLCNIERGDEGRGKRGVQTLHWELQGVFGIICAPQTHWAWSRLGEWPRAGPGLEGPPSRPRWRVGRAKHAPPLQVHFACIRCFVIKYCCHGTDPLENQLTAGQGNSVERWTGLALQGTA